mgnify:FL=1
MFNQQPYNRPLLTCKLIVLLPLSSAETSLLELIHPEKLGFRYLVQLVD